MKVKEERVCLVNLLQHKIYCNSCRNILALIFMLISCVILTLLRFTVLFVVVLFEQEAEAESGHYFCP